MKIAELVGLARPRRVHRQAGVDALGIDVVVDAAVRIAGQVGDHAVRGPGARPGAPSARSGRPGPGAHTSGIDWNTEKLTKYLSTSFSLSSSSAARCVRSVSLSRVAHAVRRSRSRGRRARALREVEAAEREQRPGLRPRSAWPRGRSSTGGRASSWSWISRRCASASTSSRAGGRHRAQRRALDLADVGHQHGVVRGQRATGLGHDPRRRQVVLGAGLGQRRDDGGGVLLQPVVDRAVAARARALVVDAQAAADVDDVDRHAGLAQLDEIARRLAHALRDVAHVGDLRAHVEVQQLQACRACRPRAVARAGPAAGAARARTWPCRRRCSATCRRRATPGACARRSAARPRARAASSITIVQLGGLLDHDEGVEPELAADQRQADVLAVLVAVADHDRAAARQRQHRHQLGLGTGLEAEAVLAVGDQLAGDVAVLVDLDRVDRGVAAVVVVVGHRAWRRRAAGAAACRRGCRRSAPAPAARGRAWRACAMTSASATSGPPGPRGCTSSRPSAPTSK